MLRMETMKMMTSEIAVTQIGTKYAEVPRAKKVFASDFSSSVVLLIIPG